MSALNAFVHHPSLPDLAISVPSPAKRLLGSNTKPVFEDE